MHIKTQKQKIIIFLIVFLLEISLLPENVQARTKAEINADIARLEQREKGLDTTIRALHNTQQKYDYRNIKYQRLKISTQDARKQIKYRFKIQQYETFKNQARQEQMTLSNDKMRVRGEIRNLRNEQPS